MKDARKLITLIMVIAIFTVVLAACGNQAAPATGGGTSDEGTPVFQIGILQLVEHPALDAARDGFLEALNEAGINFEYDFQNAQGDTQVVNTIAQRFVGNNVDLVLAIATPSVQAMAAATEDIPIVGTAITSYERAGVVYSNEAPGGNVTGASDMNPIEAQINMIVEFVPGIETLGIVYSSNEANSVYQAELAKGIAEALGLTVVEGTVTTTGDVQQNTLSIANRVEAIFIPTDNTHADAMGIVGQVSIETGVPVFPGEENMVLGGGIATQSVNYFELGKQSGQMAVQILRDGADPATMPIQFAQTLNYIVNGFMVEELGIAVPARFADSIVNP
ncbi:MAG: ABC transporter substrate-binding protein [Oscillospiraceae bacterium]|nr:ABC transporter substrate-binding protein [Oscillospiraceae bacterium]